MAERLRDVAIHSMVERDARILRVAGGLAESTAALYRELQVSLPDFATSLETSLRVLSQSLEDGLRKVTEGDILSQVSQQMLDHLAPVLSDLSRHTFTMATSDASMESFLLPDNAMSIRVKMRLEELNQLIKGLAGEFSPKHGRRASTSHLTTEDAKNVWELLFGEREEVGLPEFYDNISALLGREPRCPPERLATFFTCDFIDPLNFDRFSTLLDANSVQTADDKLLPGSATSVSQFLKSQIRIGHLRDAIPQGDSNEPIRALDSRTRTASSELLMRSPRLTLSPRSEDSDVVMESRLGEISDVSNSSWLKRKVRVWFSELDRLYRFFHGDITRDDSESLLRGRPPGTFLLRYSCTNPSRYCVSFVHSVPVSNHNSWKEQVRRRDVILHHELLCTNTTDVTSPRHIDDDVTRRFSNCDVSPRHHRKSAINGKKAFSSLHQVLKSSALLEETLKSTGTSLPGDPHVA